MSVLDAFGNLVKNYVGTIPFADTASAPTLSVLDISDPTLLGKSTVSVKAAGGSGKPVL